MNKDKNGKWDMKPIIYQMFPRIMTNTTENPKPWGTLEENGSGKLNDLNDKTLRSLRQMGINVIWMTGVIEHATCTAFPEAGIPADNRNVVKGEAGSPYAIKDYYDIDPAIAVDVPNRMKEFEECVERIHSEDLRVIIDFVPNHTARVYHSDSAPKGVEDFGATDNTEVQFSPSNNYYYVPDQRFSPDFPLDAPGCPPYEEYPAKATGNDCFAARCGRNDWYETVKLNYGHDYSTGADHFDPIPDTWLKMRDILKFWASKGVDGFRCDMVFMVPLPFWNWVIPEVKKEYPELVFIGEIYDVAQYRPFLTEGHFDYLYDKVNLYDTLVNIERYGHPASALTGCWQAVEGMGERMLNFLENHDEVRFGSNEYAGDPRKVVPSLIVSSMISTGPFMIYYGQELGESATENEGFAGYNNRSTIFDYWSYATLRRRWNNGSPSRLSLNLDERYLFGVYSLILNLCNSLKAISKGKFFDLQYANYGNPDYDTNRQFAFLRHYEDEVILIVVNFAEERRHIGLVVPEEAKQACMIADKEVTAVDLLNGTTAHFDFSDPKPIRMDVAGKSGRIWHLKKCTEKMIKKV